MKKLLILIAPLILLSCGKDDSIAVEDPPIGEEAFRYVMPGKGKIVHLDHGKEKWFAYGAMNSASEVPANGVVQGHMYEDGTSEITVQLNINTADDGSFYEAWITTEDEAALIPIGHLVNHFGDTRHQVLFSDEMDIRNLNIVHITLEQDDGNPAYSGVKLAEGVMRRVKR